MADTNGDVKNKTPEEASTKEEEKPAEPEATDAQVGASEEKADEAPQEPKKQESNKKRKAPSDSKEPTKASRRSIRGAPKSQPTPAQILNFLLSDKALDLCRPEDELKDLEAGGKDIRTYSGSELSPFEELLCAIILSRPISHRLGLRTIRTILNKPYEFVSPKAISNASPDQRHQAMFDAKTQHKDKTATQIGMLAQVVKEKFSNSEDDTSLDKLRTEAGKDWDDERDLLQTNIKGLGKTGLDIFYRRVQWLWPEAFPFVDERTARGVEKLGLPKDAEKLAKLIDQNWSELDTSGLPKGNKDQSKRRVFVVVCERATGAELEGKVEALLEGAATSVAN
ncbi:hypothetical protein K461DRAFT_288010 [Myriangium duriaei CBS 260.36]|uniref:HhH-GPD domain-containing protein n=1 Tax=Myriangium duriaei CBS 260.36 TaxID=1168546 RepID=A0A9P4ISX9_9PEZI|nr:hypothetical protein K461DRAFT_288010 [Myriangium duriaei CBS 260.36]